MIFPQEGSRFGAKNSPFEYCSALGFSELPQKQLRNGLKYFAFFEGGSDSCLSRHISVNCVFIVQPRTAVSRTAEWSLWRTVSSFRQKLLKNLTRRPLIFSASRIFSVQTVLAMTFLRLHCTLRYIFEKRHCTMKTHRSLMEKVLTLFEKCHPISEENT